MPVPPQMLPSLTTFGAGSEITTYTGTQGSDDVTVSLMPLERLPPHVLRRLMCESCIEAQATLWASLQRFHRRPGPLGVPLLDTQPDARRLPMKVTFSSCFLLLPTACTAPKPHNPGDAGHHHNPTSPCSLHLLHDAACMPHMCRRYR